MKTRIPYTLNRIRFEPILQKFSWAVNLLLNRALLIQNIYEVDPLICPKYSSEMRVIAVMENPDVIKKILKYLGLWEIRQKLPPVPASFAFTNLDAS
jgi:hypothetical protein